MKKLLICAVFMALIGSVCLCSCSNPPFVFPDEEEIKTMIADYTDSVVYNLTDPAYVDAAGIVTYRSEIIKRANQDSVFLSLPEKTLIDVATVCINKYGAVTKKMLVEEFQAHTDIYTNLPVTPTTESSSNTEGSGVTKEDSAPQKVILGTDYTYRTDTIDGVPRKIQIKTEKSYEK